MTACLSIRQPWAWLVINGHKPVENRTWSSRYRGPLLIHAGKQMAADAREAIDLAVGLVAEALPDWTKLPRGGIVGRVEMVDCVEDHPSMWFFGPYGFVFERAEPLPFRPLRGQRGFWDVEERAGSLL